VTIGSEDLSSNPTRIPLLRNIAMKDLFSSVTEDFCLACTKPQGEWFLRREPSSTLQEETSASPPLFPYNPSGCG
jgi:hypothetical protein